MHIEPTVIRDIVVVLVPMILCLSFHEWAHAWSAWRLGDDTASLQGRMTLNPLAHIDLLGTILIPAFSVLAGGIGLIGWAKPVPVSPHRFRRTITMRTGMMITALAGPGSNLLLALITGAVIMVIFGDQIERVAPLTGGDRFSALMVLGQSSAFEANRGLFQQLGIVGFSPALMLLGRVFALNLGLAVFNMLPVPPLDGSRVLPLAWQERLQVYSTAAFVGFLLLINFAGGVLSVPITFLGNGLLAALAWIT